MSEIILITGGSRSGKSRYAVKMGESLPGSRAFVATCPNVDQEMEARIRKHRQNRSPELWHTIEETVSLEKVIQTHPRHDVYLIDCLTLWINNLMYEGHQKDITYTEDEMERRCKQLIKVLKDSKARIIIITNEVGMSIIPDNPETRLYRDLIGRVNQVVAEVADKVILISCGLPIVLKGQ